MANYTVTLNRDDDQLGIKEIVFQVPENLYAMIGDILTGKLQVQMPEEAPEAPSEAPEAPSEAE